MVLAVVIPIVIQNAITNFVGLLDNLMVGSIGTEEMSGVAVANQLMFVFNLTIFGALAGSGIFGAQYYGAGNTEGVRTCHRYSMYIGIGISALAIVLFLLKGQELISLFLSDENDPVRVQTTLDFGMRYLRIMLLGLIPFTVTQCYAGTLRETGETAFPMYAGIAAVAINVIFNYLLIFGKLGLPCLGVEGAAIATNISRYAEMLIIMVYTHTHTDKYPFAKKLYSHLAIPAREFKSITLKSLPLLFNELLWSMGMTVLVQFYSQRGLDIVAAQNIESTVRNLFSISFLSLGSATAIIVGQTLGANKIREAVDQANKLTAFSVVISITFGLLLAACAGFIPKLYNTSDSIRALAAALLRGCAVIFPANGFCNASYFILRCGGKTGITFLFDSGFTWLIVVPVSYILIRFTNMNIIPLFIIVEGMEYVKCVIGYAMVKKGIWIHNIVDTETVVES